MKLLMPQEIEVWYLLPALRRELVKSLIDDYNLSQKESAHILGVTESAISQYIKNKRASEIVFNNSERKIIKEFAKKILDDRKNFQKYFFQLSQKLRGTKTLCELHKKHDKSLSKNCRICMEN